MARCQVLRAVRGAGTGLHLGSSKSPPRHGPHPRRLARLVRDVVGAREDDWPGLAAAELQVAPLGLVLHVVVPGRPDDGHRRRRGMPVMVGLHSAQVLSHGIRPRLHLDLLAALDDLHEGAPPNRNRFRAARPRQGPGTREPDRRVSGHRRDLNVAMVDKPVVAVAAVIARLKHDRGPRARLRLIPQPGQLRLARGVVPPVLRRIILHGVAVRSHHLGALRRSAAGQRRAR
mmetsp:Transcript_29260/g.83129  ORF Transcript_29260/g.83129 Transcript_29260/m.83129 type:complete len:231 (-) Transcript_29260:432-1124(-)